MNLQFVRSYKFGHYGSAKIFLQMTAAAGENCLDADAGRICRRGDRSGLADKSRRFETPVYLYPVLHQSGGEDKVSGDDLRRSREIFIFCKAQNIRF